MNLQEIEQGLAELVNSGDPEFSNAAAMVANLAREAQAGQMSPAELTEVLKDVQRQLDVINNMQQMAFKEKLNTLITGLIRLASAV